MKRDLALKRLKIGKSNLRKISYLLQNIKEDVKLQLSIILAVTMMVFGIDAECYFCVLLAVILLTIQGYNIYLKNKTINRLKKAFRKKSKDLTEVIRNGKTELIKSGDVTVGDIIPLEKGKEILFDGVIIAGEIYVSSGIEEEMHKIEPVKTTETLKIQDLCYKGEDGTVNEGMLVEIGNAIMMVTNLLGERWNW